MDWLKLAELGAEELLKVFDEVAGALLEVHPPEALKGRVDAQAIARADRAFKAAVDAKFGPQDEE